MSLNVEQNTSTNFCNNYSKSNCARKEIKIIYFDVFILQRVLSITIYMKQFNINIGIKIFISRLYLLHSIKSDIKHFKVNNSTVDINWGHCINVTRSSSHLRNLKWHRNLLFTIFGIIIEFDYRARSCLFLLYIKSH